MPFSFTQSVTDTSAIGGTIESVLIDAGEGFERYGCQVMSSAGFELVQDTSFTAPIVVGDTFSCTFCQLDPEEAYWVRSYVVVDGIVHLGEAISLTTLEVDLFLPEHPLYVSPSEARFSPVLQNVEYEKLKSFGVCFSENDSLPVFGRDEEALFYPASSSDDQDKFVLSPLSGDREYYARAYVELETGQVIYSNVVQFKSAEPG